MLSWPRRGPMAASSSSDRSIRSRSRGPPTWSAIHLAPAEHAAFYNRLRYTLNVTRKDMVQAGYSPSVRLFEAAACGTPIVSDTWPGLERFFEPGSEILLSGSTDEPFRSSTTSATASATASASGRGRVLGAHTAAHRAIELESYMREAGYSVESSTPSSKPSALETLQ